MGGYEWCVVVRRRGALGVMDGGAILHYQRDGSPYRIEIVPDVGDAVERLTASGWLSIDLAQALEAGVVSLREVELHNVLHVLRRPGGMA